MAEVLRFFRSNEIFIYLILGILAVWQISKFAKAWDELRSAAFGLEQESARNRLNLATTMLVMIIVLGIAEFGLVSLVIPGVPGATPHLTPTLDLLATATFTLEANQEAAQDSNATPQPTIQTDDDGCKPGQLEITSPQPGETVQDVVEIYGTADIANFGFYKFEMAAVNDTTWMTVQAGDVPVNNDLLGYWDTSRLTSGEYILRLIITDNQGSASNPCSVRVNVSAPSEP